MKKCSGHYMVYSSSATSAHAGGVQLWVHNDLPRKEPATATVSERVPVALRVNGGVVICVAAHHSDSKSFATTSTCVVDDIRAMIFPLFAHVAFLVDANARLGRQKSLFVGQRGCLDEGSNGVLFSRTS